MLLKTIKNFHLLPTQTVKQNSRVERGCGQKRRASYYSSPNGFENASALGDRSAGVYKDFKAFLRNNPTSSKFNLAKHLSESVEGVEQGSEEAQKQLVEKLRQDLQSMEIASYSDFKAFLITFAEFQAIEETLYIQLPADPIHNSSLENILESFGGEIPGLSVYLFVGLLSIDGNGIGHPSRINLTFNILKSLAGSSGKDQGHAALIMAATVFILEWRWLHPHASTLEALSLFEAKQGVIEVPRFTPLRN